MIRAAIVVFHLALSSALSVELATTWMQLRLNALWERSFYRQMSLETTTTWLAVAVCLGLAACEFAVILAYLAKRGWAPVALLALSGVLMFIVSPGIQWGLVAASVLVLIEEIRRRLPALREMFDDGPE